MYAMKAPVSGELYSLGGKVLVHPTREDLEWLVPGSQMVEVPGTTMDEVAARLGRPVMRWQDHPDMAGIRWPLDRRDFR
jgi:hypothetical protein